MTSKTVYTGGYAGNTPDDIIDLLNAAAAVAFHERPLLDTPEEADRMLTDMFGEDGQKRVTFKITVEKLA